MPGLVELLKLAELLELMLLELVLLTWVLLWKLVCEPVLGSWQERQTQACFALSGFSFFPGHFGLAFARFGLIKGFRLGQTRIRFCCSLCRLLTADSVRGDCDNSGGCSVLLVLLRAKLSNMPQLLAAPMARTPSFHNHHHLPLSADNDFGDGLEALPSQTKPKRIVPVGRFGC